MNTNCKHQSSVKVVKYKLTLQKGNIYNGKIEIVSFAIQPGRKMVIGVKYDAYIVYIKHQANIIEYAQQQHSTTNRTL